jgi:Ca-activated chloride channel family protein
MTKKKYTYNLVGLTTLIVAWEVIFWVLYYLLIFGLESFSGNTSEKLIFKSPGTLKYLFVIIPVIAVVIYHAVRHNRSVKKVSSKVAQSYLKPVSGSLLFLSYFFFRNAIAFLIIAMALPAFGSKKSSGTTENLELVICLDISSSMNAKDISDEDSRLEISKRAIVQLINNLHGERIGICLFANSAFVQLPITRDYGAAKLFVNDIETNMISSQGTNIDAALKTALQMFSKARTAKGIILVTDGENHEVDPSEVLNLLKEKKIQLSVLGIGTKKGGLIPKDPNRPELGYKSTASGRSVVSKLNTSFIQKIAAKAEGKAHTSSSAFPDLRPLLTEINQMKRTKIDNLEFDIKEDRYRVPLVISALFWLFFILWKPGYRNLLK